MAVYIITTVTVIALTWLAKHTKKQYTKMIIAVSIVIPTLVAGFRYNNGADYHMYETVFERIRMTGNFSIPGKTLEIGFVAMCRLIAIFTSDPLGLFLICAFIIVLAYMVGSWKISSDICFSILLFFISGTFFDSFNGIRQYMATAISFYAICYILTGNFRRYCFWIIVAELFHYTAIIMLPIYFLRNIRLRLKETVLLLLGITIGGSVMFNLAKFILSLTRYSYFLDSVEFEVVPTEASILYTLIITSISIFEFSIRKRNLSDKQNTLYLLNVIACISSLLSLSIPLMARFQYYFLPIEMIYLPELVSLEKGWKRRLLKFGLISMYLVIVVIWGMMNNEWYTCLPYNFIFSSR